MRASRPLGLFLSCAIIIFAPTLKIRPLLHVEEPLTKKGTRHSRPPSTRREKSKKITSDHRFIWWIIHPTNCDFHFAFLVDKVVRTSTICISSPREAAEVTGEEKKNETFTFSPLTQNLGSLKIPRLREMVNLLERSTMNLRGKVINKKGANLNSHLSANECSRMRG